MRWAPGNAQSIREHEETELSAVKKPIAAGLRPCMIKNEIPQGADSVRARL
jgi:hypothetical protein